MRYASRTINLDLLLDRSSGGARTALTSDADTPLGIDGLLLGADVTGRQQVERVFLLVHFAVDEEEHDTGGE